MVDLDAKLEQPKTAEAVLEIVAAAHEAGQALEIEGGGTKRGIGRVDGADLRLSTAKLDKVVDYQPHELTLTVQPGAKLSKLEALLAAQGQMLAFEPPRLTKALRTKGEPTIGGAFAANLSGPRRIRAGAARDHALGVAGVTGRGEVFKAGGKVVKNVTGYDLPKLMAGSWGTLAVLTELTLKVLPRPQTETTLLMFGLDEARAAEALGLAMDAPAEVSGAAHLPAGVAARAPLKAELATTAIRLEGFPASVAARTDHLAARLKAFGRIETLDAAYSTGFWAQIREVEAFAGDPRPLWRISIPPAAGWRVSEALPGETFWDWAGGLVWALCEDSAAVRRAAREGGGHATLYRGDGAAAFQPLDPALGALSARVKAAFDPKGILNPGRLG